MFDWTLFQCSGFHPERREDRKEGTGKSGWSYFPRNIKDSTFINLDLKIIPSMSVCLGDQEGLHGDPQPWYHEGRKQGLLVRSNLGVSLLVQGWGGEKLETSNLNLAWSIWQNGTKLKLYICFLLPWNHSFSFSRTRGRGTILKDYFRIMLGFLPFKIELHWTFLLTFYF